MKTPAKQLFLLATVAVSATALRADEVTDWNQAFLNASVIEGTSPLATSRLGAIVNGAVFDAVNGIQRTYSPVHVTPAAPAGASIRAAAVQAAYGTLIKIYPNEKATFDTLLANSLTSISASERKQSVQKGVEWGQTVADAILAWRAGDGIATVYPPYTGGSGPGQWRPTPPAYSPGSGIQFAYMTPWVLTSPSQFRPSGPAPLEGQRYAVDFRETDKIGNIDSATRTAEETLYSQFWQSSGVNWFWDRVAVSLAERHQYSLAKEARVLALMNIAIADALIACFDAKYYYSFWRPVTAIQNADTDGNGATSGDPNWLPLIVTPTFPEYPSAHSSASSAAAAILAFFFGENTSFTVDSAVMPGVERKFSNFSESTAEIKNARIFGGIHFRSSCDDGAILGQQVATYVIDHALLPVSQ